MSGSDHSRLFELVDWVVDLGAAHAEIPVSASPSIQFFPDRWSADVLVRQMSMEIRGMHFQLMCDAWMQRLPPVRHKANDRVLRTSVNLVGSQHDDKWAEVKPWLFQEEPDMPAPWIFRNGHWYQPGLCRTYVAMIESRLNRLSATFMSHARRIPAEADAKRELAMLCTAAVSAMHSYPYPLPSSLPSPFSSSSPGSKSASRARGALDQVWACLAESRDRAFSELGKAPPTMAKTQPRLDHLARLLEVYGADKLAEAFRRIPNSNWHMGRGAHSSNGSRLSFENLTALEPMNQVEALLAAASVPGFTSSSPLAAEGQNLE